MKTQRRILLVEDEEVIRTVFSRVLGRTPHALAFAGRVSEALALMARGPAFDLLVTDMRLPDGTGMDVLAAFRRAFPAGKMLVITGSPDLHIPAPRLKELGLTEKDFLYKPFELQDFEAAVERRIKER